MDFLEERAKFVNMTDEEHIAAGHYKESAGSWVDPENPVDVYFADW